VHLHAWPIAKNSVVAWLGRHAAAHLTQKMIMICMNSRPLIDSMTAFANVNKLVLSGYVSYI